MPVPNRPARLFLVCLLAATVGADTPVDAAGSDTVAPPVRQWGEETLARIDADFWLPVRHLYADRGRLDQPAAPPPAIAWGAGFQLSALAGEASYLADAHRIARAAEARWVDPATGGIRDTGRFAHLLLEGFLALSDQDHDPHWLKIDRDALNFVHAQVRDAHGHSGDRWDRKITAPLSRFPLLDEASAARAFCVADRYSIR